jgi:hypothetical protein
MDQRKKNGTGKRIPPKKTSGNGNKFFFSPNYPDHPPSYPVGTGVFSWW